MYPNYFNIQYLSQTQKDQIANTVTEYVKHHKDCKLFLDNPDMLQLVESIDNYMNTPVTDYGEVVLEQSRVLELYDSTRETSWRSLFNKLG
jgi:hypothetical protein